MDCCPRETIYTGIKIDTQVLAESEFRVRSTVNTILEVQPEKLLFSYQ
jgi:hypothetical protein